MSKIDGTVKNSSADFPFSNYLRIWRQIYKIPPHSSSTFYCHSNPHYYKWLLPLKNNPYECRTTRCHACHKQEFFRIKFCNTFNPIKFQEFIKRWITSSLKSTRERMMIFFLFFPKKKKVLLCILRNKRSICHISFLFTFLLYLCVYIRSVSSLPIRTY